MLKKFLAVMAIMLVCGSTASAGYITSNGTLGLKASPTVNNPGGNPPLLEIIQMTYDNGQLFTNQEELGAAVVGKTVRTVGITRLNAGIDGTPNANNFSLLKPGVTDDFVYAVFALEGVIEIGGANPIAKFTTGSVFFTTGEPGFSIDTEDPTKWNFAGTFSTYDLAPVGDIIPGSTVGIAPAGTIFPIASSSVNRSQAVFTQAQGDGTFVFQERVPGDSLLTHVEQVGGGFSDVDFLVASTSQLFQSTSPVLGVAEVLALDAIGTAAGFASAWSTGGYTPGSDGDFSAGLKGDLFVAAAAVPEPASLAIFAIVGVCGGLGVRRRRSRA